MPAPAPLAPCPGCGARFPALDGATHRYIGASAGCWALYAPLVAGLAPDPGLIAASEAPAGPLDAAPGAGRASSALGALLVDAYAAQHPGVPSPQAVQSVAVHLLVLHGVLRRGVPIRRALWIRRRALRVRGAFRWLAPPDASAAAWTIRHLFPGGGVRAPIAPAEYVASVADRWEGVHGAVVAEWYVRTVERD